MRRALPVFIALGAGLLLGALFSPLRYTFLTGSQTYSVYRCDRLTGRVDVAQGINAAWQTVRPRLQDLSDAELKNLPK